MTFQNDVDEVALSANHRRRFKANQKASSKHQFENSAYLDEILDQYENSLSFQRIELRRAMRFLPSPLHPFWAIFGFSSLWKIGKLGFPSRLSPLKMR